MHYITSAYQHLGAGVFALLCAGALFGVTSVIAALECRSRRYLAHPATPPFHKNYSTIADFLILNPLLIVLAVRANTRMQAMPRLLRSRVLLDSQTVRDLEDTYQQLLTDVEWIPVVIATVAWFAYVWQLRRRTKPKSIVSTFSFTNAYIGLATNAVMYVILSFTFSVIVYAWFVGAETAKGFLFEPLEWNRALDVIGDVQTSINWFYVVLAMIVLVFIIHDLILYRSRYGTRSFRILSTMTLVVGVGVAALVGPTVAVHDNLEEVKENRIEDLFVHRRSVGAAARARLTQEIQQTIELREWPLTGQQSAWVLIGQVLALVFSTGLKFGGEYIMGRARRRARGLVVPATSFPDDIPSFFHKK